MNQKFYTQAIQDVTTYDMDSYGCTRFGKKRAPSEKEFATYEEAVEAAKKTVMQTKDDVVIYKIAGVAKFPIDDIKVEEVA